MKKPTSDISPRSLGSTILVLRTYYENQTYQEIVPFDGSIKTAYKMAVETLQARGPFYKVAVLGLRPDGTYVADPDMQLFLGDAFPFYVKWEDDAGQSHFERFIKRSKAYALYTDLQRQDILSLITNSHPVPHRGKQP